MLPDLATLASAALTLVAAVIGLRLVYLTIVGFARPSLFIEEVHAATGKDEDTPGIADLIQSELAALREEGGGPGLLLMTSPDAAIDVGSIESGGGRLKELGALLRLLPGRARVVCSQMQPAGAMGQGITITIGTALNRVAATTTLWERRYVSAWELPADIAADGKDDPRATTEARECLGLAAAAWVAYQALRSSRGADRSGLLTQDWESYAQFRVGARMQYLGLVTTARRLYLDALRGDPRNRGALFNLAVLDFQEGNEPSAIGLLNAVLDELARNPRGDVDPWRFDRLWYRAHYNIAAAEFNRAYRRGTMTAADLQPIRDRIRDIVQAADTTIAELGGDDALTTGGRYADLVRFLVDVRSAAIGIYPGTIEDAA